MYNKIYNINDFYNEYKYIELKDTIKNDFIASILLGIDNKNFRKNINDFKDIIEYYKTKLNKFVNDKYNKNFTKNNKDHLNILEKLIKYNLVVYNVNKNKISYENDNKNFNKYIILLNKDNKTHLLFKYKDQKKITKLSKNDLINTDIMNGGETQQSQPAAMENNAVITDNSAPIASRSAATRRLNRKATTRRSTRIASGKPKLTLKNSAAAKRKQLNKLAADISKVKPQTIDINGSKKLLKDNININLNLIKILSENGENGLNDKIDGILTNLSNIIKGLINENDIIYNPLKKENNYKTPILDYKDIIELYILNGHDAKKDFENKDGVFQKSIGKKHYDYFENYKFLELYIIFYNLTKNNDSFNINLVTCRLADYISMKDYFIKLKDYIQFIINELSNQSNKDKLIEFINSNDNKKFNQKDRGINVGDVEYFIVIALDDYKFYDYSSFNVLNNLHSNLLIKNENTISIADTNELITIFKLYDAQNNAKTQLNILEDIPFIKNHNIKQLVLLSNFIDSGNIGADALDRLQDYKKYIPQENIGQYKKEVHEQFLNLCKIFTFNIEKTNNIVNIIIGQEDNVTKIDLNNNNILDILDPIMILKKNKDIISNKSSKRNKYKISVNISSLKIFDIIIDYEDIIKYFYNDLQYLKFSKVNYNTINYISNKIKEINGSEGTNTIKSEKIKKLLNLKALGDFSHCIFLNIFKKNYNSLLEGQDGGVGTKRNNLDNSTIENIINEIENKEILHKMKNLFFFNEKKNSSFRNNNIKNKDDNTIDKYNKTNRSFYEYYRDCINDNILPVKYLNIVVAGQQQHIRFLDNITPFMRNNIKVKLDDYTFGLYNIKKNSKTNSNMQIGTGGGKNKRRKKEYTVDGIYDREWDNKINQHQYVIKYEGYDKYYYNEYDNLCHLDKFKKYNENFELFINISSNDDLPDIISNEEYEEYDHVDVINLIYNFFYILFDDLNNKLGLTINTMKDYIISNIGKLKGWNFDKLNKINNLFNEYKENIKKIPYLKDSLIDSEEIDENTYFDYIFNVLFKIYLYDELLFMIIARIINNVIVNEQKNQEDLLIEKLTELYKIFNDNNNNTNTEENYLNKIDTYFSIPGFIEKKLNLIETNNTFEEEYKRRIGVLKEHYEYDGVENSKIKNKMFMISTIDNLLKTYCLANDLSFSVDGGIIKYNQSD